MSKALPWLERPAGLDGLRDAEKYAYALTAGDYGFDPLGWASVGWGLNEGETVEDRDTRVYAYREAELKHGRLAMLAVVGWPVSELYDGRLSERFGLASDLVNPDDAGVGLAPSLLNGGLGKVTLAYWLVVLAAGAYLEQEAYARVRESARVGSERAPGDLGFDPLGLYPSDDSAVSFDEESKLFDMAQSLEAATGVAGEDDRPAAAPEGNASLEAARRNMIEQELTHGRTAMLAIVGFAVQEFVTKVPVVEETPQFFIPTESTIEGEIELEEISRVSVEVVADVVKSALASLAPH